MRKRWLWALVLFAAVLLLAAPGAGAEAYSWEGEFQYGVADGRAIVVDYGGMAANVVVPSTLGGYPVTEIGPYVFYECAMKSVSLPEGVTAIRRGAFQRCRALKSISLPDSLATIEEYAFSGCWSLEGVSLPEGIATISLDVFYGCRSLKSVSLPDSVRSISGYAFADCTALETVDLPDGLTYIGDYVFAGCEKLKNVEIPSGVTEILENAFEGCSSLESIVLPGKVTTLYRSMFAGCSSLKSVNIPDGVTDIPYRAFYGCSSLTSLKLPASVRTIGEEAFAGLKDVSCAVLPDGVRTVGESAFSRSGLKKPMAVWVPDSAITLERWAFRGCVVFCNEGSTASRITDETVTVVTVPPGGRAVLKHDDQWLVPGETLRMDAAVFPVGSAYSWTSTDPDVARIDPDGTITALTVGTATVTLASGAASESFTVYVERFMTEFSIGGPYIVLESGETAQLSMQSFLPADATYTEIVSWDTSNSFAVSVDADGTVLGKTPIPDGGAWNCSTITATARRGVKASCVVIVVSEETGPPVTGFSLGASEVFASVGDYVYPAAADMLPANAKDKSIVLESGNERVAVTAESGVVVPGGVHIIGPGTATITVRAHSNPAAARTFQITAGMDMDVMTLPSGLERIEAEGFRGTAANKVIVPAGVEAVGARAFEGSSQLYLVEIRGADTGIDPSAFDDCPNLVLLCPDESLARDFARAEGIPYCRLP